MAAAFLCAAGALGSPESARAQDRARLHFEAGASYYEAGDYEDALREFHRAFDLSEEPKLYYNFSLCHAQLDQYAEAADAMQNYLDQVPDIENRSNLEIRVTNLRERAVGGVVDDGQGEESADGGGVSPVAIAGFAVAGAGAVMLGVFGGLALAERSDLDADPCSETRTCDAGGLRTKAVLADVGLGLLVVGAALGTVFLLIGGDDDDDATETARWRVTPSVSRDGAGLSARGVF